MNMKKTKCTCSCPVKVQSMYKHKEKINFQIHKLQDGDMAKQSSSFVRSTCSLNLVYNLVYYARALDQFRLQRQCGCPHCITNLMKCEVNTKNNKIDWAHYLLQLLDMSSLLPRLTNYSAITNANIQL